MAPAPAVEAALATLSVAVSPIHAGSGVKPVAQLLALQQLLLLQLVLLPVLLLLPFMVILTTPT